MNHRQLFSFSNTCWIKIEVLHFRERYCTIAPENVTSITFSGSITFSVVTEHARMPISSLSSQRNLNCMLLKTTEFRRKRLSLFLQLCTDLENKMLYFKFRN